MALSSIRNHGFTPGIAQLFHKMQLPITTQSLTGNILSHLDAGHITLFESNYLEEIHIEFHHLMIEAVEQGYHLTLVDLANCFNPQLISTLAFDRGLNSQEILQKISLARPFQIFQAVDIVKKLEEQIKDKLQPQFIVITDISSYFFASQLANEDKDFPIPQLQMMQETVGILKHLAIKYDMFVVISTQNARITHPGWPTSEEIQAASLQYAAKTHIKLHYDANDERSVWLKAHPYLAPTFKRVFHSVIEPQFQVAKTEPLDNFFNIESDKDEPQSFKADVFRLENKREELQNLGAYFSHSI